MFHNTKSNTDTFFNSEAVYGEHGRIYCVDQQPVGYTTYGTHNCGGLAKN